MCAWKSEQWRTFAKTWYLYDAYMQCPMLSGEKIANYLLGKHKPLYSTNGNNGDEVIVFNSRHIAVKDNSLYWQRYLYPFSTRFGKHVIELTMKELHYKDPKKVISREIRGNIKHIIRENVCMRLHIFPDGIETVPKSLLSNVTGVIRQVQPIMKSISDFSNEEIDNFPTVIKIDDQYCSTDFTKIFDRLETKESK